MDTKQIAANLRDQLDHLTTRLDQVKQDARRTHSSDWSEQAQERENDEVLDGIGNQTSVLISEIQSALERIENGTYGSCTECGKDIDPARLKTLPHTPRCQHCAA